MPKVSCIEILGACLAEHYGKLQLYRRAPRFSLILLVGRQQAAPTRGIRSNRWRKIIHPTRAFYNPLQLLENSQHLIGHLPHPLIHQATPIEQ